MPYYVPTVHYSPNGGGHPCAYVVCVCTTETSAIKNTIKYLIDTHKLPNNFDDEIFEELEYDNFNANKNENLLTNLINYTNNNFKILENLFDFPETYCFKNYCNSWCLSVSIDTFHNIDKLN